MTSRRRAFTLVELLVVIGVVALLVAVLLPALRKARDHADRVKCAANLRCIGQAMTMYTQQYRYYPACWVLAGPGTNYAIWPTRLRPFLGGDRDVFFCPAQDERCRWTDQPAAPGPAAPAALTPFGYDAGEPLLHVGTWFSYGYNLWGLSFPSMSPQDLASGEVDQKGLGFFVKLVPTPTPGMAEVRANHVRVPSAKIAVTDATADGDWDVAVCPRGNPAMYPGQIHGGGANVLFCDGHAQWYSQKDLLNTNPRDIYDTPAIQTARSWMVNFPL